MEVELYVYDLSQGLARQYSRMLTGVHIDAIYHTAIVINNVEYFFGQGIHRKVPGSTHHGRPMSIVNLGKTDIPIDVIDEYIESLEPIYTPESYDLFLHNCNNFTQDLSMFLVGKSIPEEIRSLPETFLNTPIGQMLRGQIDQSMRTMTQAPDAAAGQNASKSPSTARPNVQSVSNGVSAPSKANRPAIKQAPIAIINANSIADTPGRVHYVSSIPELDNFLESARGSCAVIFFTSATCPPCKIVYPTYDELAAEASEESGAKLIKVDISASMSAHAVAQRYQVRATPTFITFLKGQKQDEWAGANPAQLRGNVRLLLQMAKPAQHRHATLKLPTFQRPIEAPIMFTKLPPVDKLLAKIGPKFCEDASVQGVVAYIQTRESKGMSEAPLPDLDSFTTHVSSTFASLPREIHFALIDLVRVAAVDPRVSSFLVTEHGHKILSTLLSEADYTSAPYNIQSVSLQLACNLFGSSVFQERIYHATNDSGSTLRAMLETLASQCLLSPHRNARSMAAALVYNLSAYTHNQRMLSTHRSTSAGVDADADADSTALPSDDLSAALLESISSLSSVSSSSTKTAAGAQQTVEALHALLLALGMLLYAAPPEEMLWDLCRAMDLQETLREIRQTGLGLHAEAAKAKAKEEPLLKEVGDVLLGQGGF